MSEPIQFTEEIVYNGGINEAQSSTKIGDNQWVSGENVETLPDGCRMRLGYANENSTQLPVVDELHEGGTSSRLFVDTTSEYIAQGFKLSATADCIAIEVRLKIGAGTPTVVLKCAVYTDSAGDPNAAVSGLDITDFSSVAAANLGTNYKWFRFSVATGVSLTLNTQYHLVISQLNASSGNEAAVEEVTTPSGYSDGTVHVSPSTVSWTNVPAADLNFRVLTGTGVVTGIKDYSLSDASTEFHMVFANRHLYKNVAGTFTPVSQNPRVNEYVANKDTHPSMVVANDRLMLTDGTDPSQQFYTQSSVEYYENVGILAPTTVPTFGKSSGSNVADGTWEIDYFYYNSRTGQSSRRKYDGLSALSSTTSSQQIDLSVLPSTTVRTNDAATSIRIEAKQPSSSVFRLVADASGDPIDVTLGITTVSITSANTFTLLAEYDDDVPPQHTSKLIAENRQFFIGNTTNPWRLYYSKISGGVPFYESVPSTNFRDFGRGDGDYTTALAFMSPRTLIVGFKNSIWALDVRDPGVSDRVRIANGVGIANHQSLIIQGNTMYFVSNADKQKGMFKWSPGMVEPEHMLGIDDTFQGLKFSRLDNCSSTYYAPDNNRHQWWTTFSGPAQNDQSKILVYDTKLDSWTDYNIAANVLGLVEETSASEVFVGRTGYESKADNGTTDAGTAVAAKFKTKDYSFGMNGVRKKTRIIDYVASRKASASISVAIETDFGAGSGGTATLDYPALGAAFVLGTDALGATDRFLGGGTGDFNGRKSARALGRLISYEFASQTNFHLKTVSYGIQKTGRR